MISNDGNQTEAKTLQVVKEGDIVNGYAVINIKDLKRMLKEANRLSRIVYDGKVRGQSSLVLKVEMMFETQYASKEGAYQCRVEERNRFAKTQD